MESVTSFKCGFVNNIGSRIVRELVETRITSPDRHDSLSLATFLSKLVRRTQERRYKR